MRLPSNRDVHLQSGEVGPTATTNAEPECNVAVLGSVSPELVRVLGGERVVICRRESDQHLLGEREPEHVVRVLDHRNQASEVVGIPSQMPQALADCASRGVDTG